MKKHLNTLMAIIILVGAFAVSAHAQANSSQTVLADIPFAFNVGKTNLPAGKYSVTVLNPSSDRKILQIRSRDGGSSAMIMTNSASGNASDNAKLVFHRYGDRYFFAKAQMDGTSLDAVQSSAEREQARMLAVGVKKTVIAIAAE